VGLGALPPPSLSRSRAQDTLDARDAALNDALRTLGMAVQQVRVNSESRVSNYTLQSDKVRVRLAAVVKNAEVIEEKLLPETGIYRIVVQAPLTGAGSIAEAVGVAPQKETPPEVPEARTDPVAPVNPYAPGAPVPEGATYTGLIIDCRGLGIVPCRSPKVYDMQGNELYGTMEVAPDFVDEFGIVSYPRTLADAQREGGRAGSNPLIVQARGISDNSRSHPLVSLADARRIRDANRSDHFLERTAVVFIVDR
jgi:hypothetical protein